MFTFLLIIHFYILLMIRKVLINCYKIISLSYVSGVPSPFDIYSYPLCYF
nr:MAG TPA: hypothetical protein [Bacteriophage sp.]